MLLQAGSDDSTIVRMRVQALNLDPLTARLRVGRMLNSARLRPTSLPPQATLFIRRLKDPLPGALHLEAHDSQAPAPWQEALTKRIDQLVAAAAYPARGAVANDSEAVIFLQQSELLACLALDWLQSALTTRWWWQSFLRGGDVSQLIKLLWRDSPEYVPAALQHLLKRDSAVRFVASLGDGYVHVMMQSIARSFALRALLPALEKPLPRVQPATIKQRSRRETIEPAFENEPTVPAAQAPWLEHVPETETPELSPEQQRFLGITLMIRRAPAQVRSDNFSRAVERWQVDILSGAQTAAMPVRKLEPVWGADTKRRWRPEIFVDETDSVSPRQAHVVAARQELPADRMQSDPETLPPAALPRAESPEESAPNSQFLTARVATDSSNTEPISVPPPQHKEDSYFNDTHQELEVFGQLLVDPPRLVDDDDVDSASTEIETNLGGVFYLINLAQYLNLYGDFTTPATLGIDLNIWDFVTFVAQEFVGDAEAGDPIWPFLAELGGREIGDPPGENFHPEDEWRLPPEWLSSFDENQPCQWHAQDGRLRLLHAEGFAILDLPLAGSGRAQLQREVEPYGKSIGSTRHSHLPKLAPLRSNVSSTPVRRWLSLLVPYLRARLRLALDLESHERIAEILFCHGARVRATDTHLDVFFGLSDLSFEIRFAGLDRDPGWVPAAARFIAFHFE